jgi:leader peptidase (prepilin peptidase)/N-methyltransferase
LFDLVLILFVFALGACIGSFLNVVVWRLPRGESLVSPPSHCPQCDTALAWYDNVPIFGWLFLRGRCRYCQKPISIRYPLVELVSALLLVFYYLMFFIFQVGPCPPGAPAVNELGFITPHLLVFATDWPIYALYMFLILSLLAASLIDAELFIIPISIPWLMALVGFIAHPLIDAPDLAGSLIVSPSAAALAAGGGVGLLVSLLGWAFGWIPTSFAAGEPALEVDRDLIEAQIKEANAKGQPPPQLPPEYTPAQIRSEMRHEMLFLLPPLLGAFIWTYLTLRPGPLHDGWQSLVSAHWIGGLLGSILGALIGGLCVWLTRILGTLAFGRVAMGLGDVHLMFGVGAVVGAGPAAVAFFIAPFFGILFALYALITRSRRELPYGPYLSAATAFVLLVYCPIAEYLRPGMQVLASLIQGRGLGG